MPSQFDFMTAPRILFGSGKVKELPSIVSALGDSVLFVVGKETKRFASVMACVEERGVRISLVSVGQEPTVDLVRSCVPEARASRVIVAIGGGSVMDAAKAIAAVAANSGEPLDYLEVVGRGRRLENPAMPWIAVPTTAGTGAEVTRNAVLDSTENGVKASIRDPSMLARAAIVDPELTVELPPAVTAYTGLDALTQLIEPYVSIRANAFTDMFCLKGLKRVSGSLKRAYADGTDLAARENMSFASLLGGLALANAGLGVVHGFAAPLGGMLHAPHGALCAAVLPAAVKANIRALRERASNSPALDRYRTVAGIVIGDHNAAPEQLVEWLADLCGSLHIAGLAQHGLSRERIPELIDKARQASSMKANPLVLNPEELQAIAEASL